MIPPPPHGSSVAVKAPTRVGAFLCFGYSVVSSVFFTIIPFAAILKYKNIKGLLWFYCASLRSPHFEKGIEKMTATLTSCSYDIDWFGEDDNAHYCKLSCYMREVSLEFPQVYSLTISEKQWSKDPAATTHLIKINKPYFPPRDRFEVYVSNGESGDRCDWGDRLLFTYNSALHEVYVRDMSYTSSERVKVAAGIALYHFLRSQTQADIGRFEDWMAMWGCVTSSEQTAIKLKEHDSIARWWAMASR